MFGLGMAMLTRIPIFRGLGYAFMACCCCFAIGKLLKCQCCSIRDCHCCKRLLRWSGHDKFDDFDLMVVVLEASCDHKKEKLKTFVRVSAGGYAAQTDASSKGKFQQPLHIHVLQGTEKVTIELWEEKPSGSLSGPKSFASMSLKSWEDIRNQSEKGIDKPQKRALQMKKKGTGIDNPSVTFYMSVGEVADEESGLLKNSELDLQGDAKIMLQQQLKRAAKPVGTRGASSGDMTSEDSVNEIQQLKRACAGSLDMFGHSFGGTTNVYVAVRGPPDSRQWIVGVWNDKEEFERRAKGILEIDVKRIRSVQQDPGRSNVFCINYFDHNRVVTKRSFRIIDLNRDVWVNMLKMMVGEVYKYNIENKKNTSHREKTRKLPA